MGITAQRAREFGIEPQREGESDIEFRGRVSGRLREQGHIIEAHEAYQDELYDQSEGAMTGILGAAAQAFRGVDYGKDGARQVGDDIAAGHITQEPEDGMTPEMALLIMALFGGK